MAPRRHLRRSPTSPATSQQASALSSNPALLPIGALLLAGNSPGLLLQTKIGFGLVAIGTNIYCVRLVFRRAAAAASGQWQEFSRLDRLQHKLGAGVAFGILMALSIGVYVYSRV